MITKREALQWLHQNPDAVGECDGCHKDNVKLWMLPIQIDTEMEANWMYCRQCFAKSVNRNCQTA